MAPAPAFTLVMVNAMVRDGKEPVAPANLADLEAVTAVSFGHRRKMLRQSLKDLTHDAEAMIREADLDPTERPEQLSVTEFARLARAWERRRVESAMLHMRE